MLKKIAQWLIIVSLTMVSRQSLAQDTDTTNHLNEVVITGYLSRQPILEVPASVAVIDSKALLNGSQQSLLPVVNTVPGVRMEERSPGSYRLSIRGSLLRSPFGVRNVKMYLNDLPFTDASGNTYLNLVDPALLQRIEILKGPDGSLFGANSGGVVLMDSELKDSSSVHGSVSGGSYGLFRQHVLVNYVSKKVQWNFGEAYQRSDGYRRQTAMERLSLFGSGKLNYGPSNSVKLTALFSDLHYETPGGLTKVQYEDDPQQARPGAVTQQTGIYNTTFFGGLTNELNLSSSLRHIVSVFGTHTDYENPFITNYEIRNEKNAGFRTFLEYVAKPSSLELKFSAGAEGQWGRQTISNYYNVQGNRGTLMVSDTVSVSQLFYFTRMTLNLRERLTVEIGLSVNHFAFDFESIGKNNPEPVWMPRIAMSYAFSDDFAVRASVSKGYSPPTIVEIRYSGLGSNPDLRAEIGWNTEAGLRFTAWNNRVQGDASVFYFELTDAIVRGVASNDAEYFLNAGGTDQTGIECMLSGWLIPHRKVGLIRGASMQINYTYSHFRFDDYVDYESDYSGNKLTGVPESNLVTGFTLNFPKAINFYFQTQMTSRIPLNDANSEYADHYELLQAKLGWIAVQEEKLMIEFFAGADNLLSQKYSLGNDLNAFGGRYYNAAPLRNFYGGINVKFN